jgi:hypothetical protein
MITMDQQEECLKNEENNEESLLIYYATQHYSNNNCRSFAEFESDLQRIQKIRKLLTRRETQNRTRGKNSTNVDRILLNHVIILFNVFTIVFAKTLLFASIDERFHPTIKTILIFLSFMNEDEKPTVPLDPSMIQFLSTI